ncbi:hypothetical protein Hanom_Chr15g01399821 [Helianthus anomalus]
MMFDPFGSWSMMAFLLIELEERLLILPLKGFVSAYGISVSGRRSLLVSIKLTKPQTKINYI